MLVADDKACPSYTLTIYMAGDYDTARRVIRQECYIQGLCVTLRRELYTYTGGEEEGIAVTFQNYPRFPSTPEDIIGRATFLRDTLLGALCQRSSLIVTPTETRWYVVVPQGQRN